MTPLLEIRKLKLGLGAFTLGEMSLALAPGDYLVLLGPSGCGKTSLLRAVAGLLPVGRGQLWLEGTDCGNTPPHRRRVSYVSQSTDLFPHLNVAQNIGFGLSYLALSRTERRRRIERISAQFGIAGLLGRETANLSGGESKRVALARGLVVNPRVLLLDEPLSGVDEHARAGMFEALKMIHDELGTATVHVTHDRVEAAAMGGRCAVMRAGRIEQEGALEELLRRPRTEFVAEFLGRGRQAPQAGAGSGDG